MEGTILFGDVYKAITSGEAFDATVIKCDRKRGTGGEIMRLEGWMITGQDHKAGSEAQQTTGEQLAMRSTTFGKDPGHDQHGTVNVFNPANSGQNPISLHWDLIRIFNGKRVIN